MTPTLRFSLEFSPAADLESWRLTIPAHAACYALDDEQGRTQLLATTGNLRNTLVRRLAEPAADQTLGKRVDYRAVVRRVRYRPVYSRFEANWVYLENTRLLYPKQAARMMRHRRAAWVSVNEADAHPRFMAADVPCGPAATCFGPFSTVKAARSYIHVLEDLFDLCREHHLLVQAPGAVACSYKQMGRCPAPCDGSITMDAYRQQVRAAVAFISGTHRPWTDAAVARMKRAAAELKFERAAQIKAQIDKARAADSPASYYVAPLSDFRHLLLERGQRKGRVRVFLVAPGVVEFVGEMVTKWRDEQVEWLAKFAAQWFAAPPSSGGSPECTNLVAWHRVGGEREPGVFLPAQSADDPDRIRAGIERLAEKLAKRRADRTGTAIQDQS